MCHAKRKRAADAVELNLAAMLDMAFQLLAFFTITFQAAPAEVEIQMHLPRAASVDSGARLAGLEEPQTKTLPDIGRNTLVVSVIKSGDAFQSPSARYWIEYKSGKRGPYAQLADFQTDLQTVVADEGLGFEQVIVRGGGELPYGKIVEVIEACARVRLPSGKLLQRVALTSAPIPDPAPPSR